MSKASQIFGRRILPWDCSEKITGGDGGYLFWMGGGGATPKFAQMDVKFFGGFVFIRPEK